MKNRINGLLILLCVITLVSCNYEEYASADYPNQKIYLPAAAGENGFYVIDDVPALNLSVPTQGQPYQFFTNIDANTLTIPLAVYRSGVNNKGKVTVDISTDAAYVNAKIADGGLTDTQLLPADKYTLTSAVDIVDGKELASFNLTVDLRFLKENAPQGADAGEKKYAIAIRIASNDREVNPDLNTLIVVIDTKMMNPVADFYTQTETVWNQILFTSTAKYATAYHWSFGDATEISDYKPRHTYGQSGIYAVTLTVTGIAGDVVSKTIALPVLNILPLDKLEWSVVDFSSEELGEATTAYPELGHVTAVFDDNIATYWSSAYLTTIASSPHWFVLDLGATYTIKTIKTEKRQNNSNGQRAYRLFTSIDGINWEDHGQYAINQSLNQTIVLDLDYPQAQYIKYEAVRGGATRDIAFLAEITVFGTLAE